MKTKILFLLILLGTSWRANAQYVGNCDLFCVTEIKIDSAQGNLLVSIFNGDTSISHINYPFVDFVLDSNGDTIADGGWPNVYYAHLGNTTQTYEASTALTSWANDFTGTIFLSYSTLAGDNPDTMCVLSYPCTTPSMVNDKLSEMEGITFPNPFTLSTTITTKKEVKNASLLIFDLLGQKIKIMESLYGSRFTFSRDNLRSGSYYYKILEGNSIIQNGKLIVQ